MTAAPPTGVEGVLERFLADVVTDDYEAIPSAGGSGVGQARKPGPLRHLLAAAGLAVIGVLVAVAVTSTQASDAARQSTRSALVDRVTTLSAAVDEQQSRVDAQTDAVDSLREQVLAAGDAGDLTQQTTALAGTAGTTDVAGPGVTVTVDDAPEANAESLNRVLDRDLQDIVNALWRGGATAIAVNGQRLVSTTAVRGAGEAILVNFQPLTRPYRVTALAAQGGSIDTRGTRSLLSTLSSDYGLVTDISEGDVALPAGTVRPMRFATPTEGSSTP